MADKEAGEKKDRETGPGETVTMKEKGKKPITFQKGGLHKSLGVPQGQAIPASKMQGALHGDYGAKAQKQAEFAANVLAQGRRTAHPGSA